MADTDRQRVLQEFLAEAEDLLVELEQRLEGLEGPAHGGPEDPEALNAYFRAIHSLKGLSGMCGCQAVASFSHKLEHLLDELRLGRIGLTPEAYAFLRETQQALRGMLAALGVGREEEVSPALLERLDALLEARDRQGGGGIARLQLDAAILRVLTEYEEHRLKENLRRGRRIYLVRAHFPLESFDRDLSELQERLRTLGEVLTTLPSPGGSSGQGIDFQLLIGSDREIGALAEVAGQMGATVEAVGKEEVRSQESAPIPIGSEQVGSGQGVRSQGPGVGIPQNPDVPRAAEVPSLKSLSDTVRVDIQRLDHLMNLVGELVMTKAQILEVQRQLRERAGFSDLTVDLFRASRSLERKLGELQEGIVAVRMVPVGQVFSRLHQFVRTFARESGKEIEFHVFGEETEIDKRMLEEISDPLIHIIRNAVDHGIEPVEVRRRQGKPERGTVAVRAFPKGSYVVVTVEDDGAGIDPQEVLRSAHRRGLVAEDSLLEESEILNLIFLPGFTTSEAVTEISGRGVGLDVVRKNLVKLRGRIDVESDVGVGTRMTLTFPITLAIVRALAIRSGSETFAIPLSAVIENLRVAPAQVRTVEGREVLQLRGATLSLCRLDRLFDLPAAPRTADPLLGETETQEQEYLYVVIVGIAERRLGLVVERILGQQEIVIRSLGEACPHASGIAGATELGDGEIVLVLDVEALIAETLEGSLSRPAGGRLAV